MRATTALDSHQLSWHALHHAVHTPRDRLRAAPSLWASYLHAGA
ncbi:hypothetical protein ACFV5G_23415 [Streptomyces sp. NPDC059766]